MPVVSMLRDIQTQTFGHEEKEESGMFMIRASPTLMHTHTDVCETTNKYPKYSHIDRILIYFFGTFSYFF